MKPALLVLADADSAVEWIADLERNQFIIRRFTDEREVLEASAGGNSLILVRLDAPPRQLPALFGRLSQHGKVPVILIQARESFDLASTARACGVSDYLREPFAAADLVSAVQACLAEPRASRTRTAAAWLLLGGERMVGGSSALDEVRRQIARIAATDCNVLITGETGTGKELAAELIHRNSRRKERRLVCINCAAIPEALLESELFGYEKGAFTGAQTSRPGHLELADGGVLFLDEISEMSLSAQAKILRAIEGKELQRLGRRTAVKVDVRIVCATNRDLETEVRRGTFRADLFFRLHVAHLELPPLRERKEDLRELAAFYFQELNARMGLQVDDFTAHSWRSLLHHDWPGNVREFKNVIEASLVQIPFPRMRLVELPEEFHRQFAPVAAEPSESERLLAALVCHDWNKSKAAKQLQWSRMTLYRKMVKYQLAPVERVRTRTA